MSDRRRPSQQTAGRDMLRDINQRIDRLERQQASLQRGQVSNGVVQLIGNGAVKITVAKSGVEEGRIVTFENTLTGSTVTIDLP